MPAPAVLSFAALLAILPILVRGPSCGHDFDFHLLSWLEAANQFAHFGYPHWAFTPGWNAGEPRFIFYPPLSWTLGGILGLFIPWNFVPAAFTWVALTLSGLTMHRFARSFASPDAALLAATLYLANPYMLFTAYERTAYGELLAAAWLPLLFAAALAPKVRVLPLALPIALLWLTNAPAAVMGCYALAILTALRLCFPVSSRLRLAFSAAAGTALGLAFAAFYIVPAAWEQRFVQVDMAIIAGMRPADHFLFHRMGSRSFDDLFHDQVVRTASLVSVTLLTAILLVILVSRVRRISADRSLAEDSPLRNVQLPLILLALLIAFLLTPPSLPIWNLLPKLAFLQFPWRLTALLGVIVATLFAATFRRLTVISSLIPLPLALALVLPAWHFFHQPCDSDDAVPARVGLFHSSAGTDPTDEYTPIGVQGDAEKSGDPPYWLIPASADPNAAPLTAVSPGQPPLHLTLNLSGPEYLVLNLRQYPTWRARLNGADILPIPGKRPDGLITLLLPSGRDTLDLKQIRTPDQNLGLGISAIAIVCTLAFAIKTARSKVIPGP